MDQASTTLLRVLWNAVSQAQRSRMHLSHGQALRIGVEGMGMATANDRNKSYTTVRLDAVLELTSAGASLHT